MEVTENLNEDAQSEDEKKKYTLKCLEKMGEKSGRYWSAVLNQLMPN
jgi:hypothetical protein